MWQLRPESPMHLKLLLKRGALLTAANWPTVAIQFVAGTTFQALLAVPVLGAAVLVAVLLGADLADLLQGSLRDVVTTLAAVLAYATFFVRVISAPLEVAYGVRNGTLP